MGAENYHMDGRRSHVDNEQDKGKSKDSLTPTRHGSL